MQQTYDSKTDKLHEELFQAYTDSQLEEKMETRLRQLEGQGHQLVKRESVSLEKFYQQRHTRKKGR